jgi:hypothetical protein
MGHPAKGDEIMTTRKIITKGRYQVTIAPNGSGFYAILSRDGQCLPGIPGRGYATEKTAENGAKAMLKKAGA